MEGYFEINGEPELVRESRKKVLEAFKDLEFFEDGHKYLLNGKSLNSVSGIPHRFLRKPFDQAVQATCYAERHGRTPEYWIEKWESNSFRATTLGTKAHAFGESLSYLRAGHPELMNPLVRSQYMEKYGYLAPIHATEMAAERFLTELPDCYHLVLNETKVYSGKNPDSEKNLKEQICGTFDMLYYYDGEGDESKAGFVIMDYKTNDELTKENNRKYGTTLLSPFDDFFEEPLSEYAIQLSLYALMLEDIGLKVIDRFVIWLKKDVEKLMNAETGKNVDCGRYEKIHVEDLSERLRRVL